MVKKTTVEGLLMSVDENKDVFQKKDKLKRQPVSATKKMNAKLPADFSGSPFDRRAVTAAPMRHINFLKTLAEMKKLTFMESLYEVIYSYEFFQDSWKHKGWGAGQTLDAVGSGSESGQPLLKLYFDQTGDKYLEGWKDRCLFKLLQFKREEIFNEIFMGFRFSFGSKSVPILVEMNISPFPDKGQGLIIAF